MFWGDTVPVMAGLCLHPSVLLPYVLCVLTILMLFFRLLYLKYYGICNCNSNGTSQKFADMLSLYSNSSPYEIMKCNCLKKHCVLV